MAWLKPNRPWYADGLAFECAECGGCCSGPEEGYVWITPEEIAAAAKRLGIEPEQFRRDYTRKVGRRMSLIEKANKDCVFLEGAGGDVKHCRIYEVRPSQCQTWPFWPGNLKHPGDWALAQMRCPGINRGKLHDVGYIEDEKART